jgi:hypothetical protein
MIGIVARREMDALLREGMRERLAQFDPSQDGEYPALVSHEVAEESLRLLLIKHRPLLAAGVLPPEHSEELKSAIDAIVSQVGWHDVRYIDALNLLYETWQAGTSEELRNWFLRRYRLGLEQMLAS